VCLEHGYAKNEGVGEVLGVERADRNHGFARVGPHAAADGRANVTLTRTRAWPVALVSGTSRSVLPWPTRPSRSKLSSSAALKVPRLAEVVDAHGQP